MFENKESTTFSEKKTNCFFCQNHFCEKFITNIALRAQNMGGATIVVLMFLTVAHVIGRYFLGSPLPGMVELSSFMLVIIIFLTSGYNEVAKAHTVIRIAIERFPEKVQAIIDTITYLMSLVIIAIACWQSIVRAIFTMKTEYSSAVWGIPHFPFLLVVAFGWLILGLAVLMNLIHSYHKAVGRCE